MEFVLRNPVRNAIAVCVLPLLAGIVGAQPTAASRQSQIVRAGSGIVLGASIGQALQFPQPWAQTPRAFAYRLADQTGMFAIRSLAYRGLTQTLAWHADTAPCPVGIVAVARCAVTQTVIARTTSGAARPDLARIGSLALAAGGSLLWRPDRLPARDAGVQVLARVGSGLAFAVVRRGIAASRRAPVVPTATPQPEPARRDEP